MARITRDEHAIVEKFAKSFEYKYDPELGKSDTWSIITEKDEDGKYRGDCEDFSLTVLYKLKCESLLATLWALVTFQAIIWFVRAKNGGGHAVMSYKGQYIDNWTKRFVSKDVMYAECGHKFKFPYPFPSVFLKMIIGAIKRKYKK